MRGRAASAVRVSRPLLGRLVLAAACLLTVAVPGSADEIRIASFSIDVTIPPGHRCMGVLPTKSQRIADPLEAIGFVLSGSGQPIIVIVVDWCELRNGAYDLWRDTAARAGGTSRERVLVSCVHQHDAPIADVGAARLLREVGLARELYDPEFHADVLDRLATAIRDALPLAEPVTHLGLGRAEVRGVASNRRVERADGSVTWSRGSRSGGNAELAAAPVGLIDPQLRTLSFWNHDTPLLALSSYATHPMSFYGQGEVSADFPGLARRKRQAALPEVLQIYASGCSGDVTAGKYNDGSPDMRRTLAQRLDDGMRRAWESTRRVPLRSVAFRSVPLTLDYSPDAALGEAALTAVLQDAQAATEKRILAAMGLSSLRRVQSGQPIDFPCLDFGPAQLVLFPGESFVAYQRMAQQMRPDGFVMSVGYGECWTGYIPTAADRAEGFDGHGWQWVAPGAEEQIRNALQSVLAAPAAR